MRLLSNLLKKFIEKGSLQIIDAQGKRYLFDGQFEGPKVTARIHDKALYNKLFFNPELHAGEAYMDGTLTFEDGSNCYDFLYLFSINRKPFGEHPAQKILREGWKRLRGIQQHNPIGKAAQNASHHYDISEQLYRLFLCDNMQYTCAYFNSPEETIEQAQVDKKRHICAKLGLEDGMKIAEFGCGWGGFALYMASLADVEITAVNLSGEQIRVCKERAKKAGVEHRVHFKQMDYRELDGKFDRVVSVGMLEHIGANHYDELFGHFKTLLNEDGFGFLHSIGRMSPPGTTSPFLRKYIFPGGYAPALSEVFASTERLNLCVADTEIWRLHYVYTLKAWRTRFMENWDQAAEIYDERFCRMWEFYLVASELGFLHGSNMIFQLLLSNKREAVPVDRNYIINAERAMLATENGVSKKPKKTGKAKRTAAPRPKKKK
jgi:cyclopropane-fatty-acyl-phospholipid synthase